MNNGNVDNICLPIFPYFTLKLSATGLLTFWNWGFSGYSLKLITQRLPITYNHTT